MPLLLAFTSAASSQPSDAVKWIWIIVWLAIVFGSFLLFPGRGRMGRRWAFTAIAFVGGILIFGALGWYNPPGR